MSAAMRDLDSGAGPPIRAAGGWERLAVGATIALFAFFAAAILHSAFYNPFVFDSAIHAIVAKNVARGYGWAMSYHTRDLIVPITTGPGLIMPAALMVAVFGNQIWVPAVTAGLVNLVLLAVLLWRLHRLVASRWTAFALTLGLLGVFLHFHVEWWTTFVGETASLLLFLIACTVAVDPRLTERRRYFVLGVLAGLTILTRMLALPGFGGIALYLLFARARAVSAADRDTGAAGLLRLALIGTAGVALVVLPFRVYEALQLWQSPDYSYADQMQFNRQLFWSNAAIGIGRLLRSPTPSADIARNVVHNARTLVQVLASDGIPLAALGAGALVALVLVWRALRSAAVALDRLMLVGLCGLAGYLAWYLCLLSGEALIDRYAVQPLLLLFCLAVMLAARTAPILVPILLVALILPAPPARAAVTRELLLFRPPSWFGGRAAEYNAQVLAGAAFLDRTRFRYPLANCGWLGTTRELEFLLPGINNFKDCYQLIEEALEPIPLDDSGADPAGARYRWKHPVNFTLVINNLTWPLAAHYEPTKLRQAVLRRACAATPLYKTELYDVVECEFAGLEREVPLDAATPFVGTPPEWTGNR